MSSETEQAQERKDGAGSRDPRVAAAKAIGDGDQGREMVAHAAQGAELDEKEERAALDFLLGSRPASKYEVEVEYYTPEGPRKMWFLIKSIDTRRIDAIEERNVDQNTGRVDQLTSATEIVAAACDGIRDTSGRTIDIRASEFLTVEQRNPATDELEKVSVASPALALNNRFRDQLGLVQGVAIEIKRIAGFSPERVSRAKRMQVSAALG